MISEAALKFGSQCVVVAIDAKRRPDGGWNIYKNGGRVDMGIDAVEWAMKADELGAGEILLTSMDCDGTKDGYDLELTKIISDINSGNRIGRCGQVRAFSRCLYRSGSRCGISGFVIPL